MGHVRVELNRLSMPLRGGRAVALLQIDRISNECTDQYRER